MKVLPHSGDTTKTILEPEKQNLFIDMCVQKLWHFGWKTTSLPMSASHVSGVFVLHSRYMFGTHIHLTPPHHQFGWTTFSWNCVFCCCYFPPSPHWYASLPTVVFILTQFFPRSFAWNDMKIFTIVHILFHMPYVWLKNDNNVFVPNLFLFTFFSPSLLNIMSIDLEMEPSAQPAVAKTAGVFDKDAHSHSSVIVNSLTKKFSIFICVLSIALCLWSI